MPEPPAWIPRVRWGPPRLLAEGLGWAAGPHAGREGVLAQRPCGHFSSEGR